MTSLCSSVAWWARSEPNRIALIYKDQRVSYAGLQNRVEVVAAMLVERGVRPGNVVALLMKNSAAFVELALAISYVGAVSLPINYRLAREEVAYIAEHGTARLMFVDEELRGNAGGCEVLMALNASAQSDSRELARGLAPLKTGHASGPQDLFRLMYTSGTTDRPKGVTHSYENYAWKCFDHIAALGLSANDRLLVVGPLYHVGAFDLPGLAVLQVGGMVAIQRDFDAQGALAMIEAERLTGGWMAPVMLDRVLALPGRERFDLSSFRWLVGGGERTPEQRIREFKTLFRAARYVDAYGLTETCSGDTMMEAGRELEKIGSTGRALANVEIEIRNEEGRVLPSGQEGEICVRGPKVSAGYWRDEQKTLASFHDDWFRTGDIGYLDAEGFLFLTDRKKDMILSGGENIASSEVERVLYQLPPVAEAAVVGIPDERWGERVVAVVVLRGGESLSVEDVRSHCEGRLAGFKAPKQLVVVEELPRNPSGKVLKRAIRDRLAEEKSAT
jgi:fatty-acyl-CoA synthase